MIRFPRFVFTLSLIATLSACATTPATTALAVGQQASIAGDVIGVDEEQAVTARGLRSGIARGGDVAVLDTQHARASGAGEGAGRVAGCVIDHDDFVCERQRVGRGPDRCERGTDQERLVMRGDDEGDHPMIIAESRAEKRAYGSPSSFRCAAPCE